MWLTLFQNCVNSHPNRVAVITPEVRLTYAELLARAKRRGQELREQNTRLAPRCLLVSKDPLNVVEAVKVCKSCWY